MNLLKQTFRRWWQKPRAVTDIPAERTVSFLELFYDLAYVVIIIQLTHLLVDDLTLPMLAGYIGLYAAVWFAWINGSFYHDLHGNNDIRTRVFTFLQMFSLAWMGISIHNAMGDGHEIFAFAYAGFLATLAYLWWRTGVHDRAHKPLSDPYSIAFLGATAAFLYSTQLSLPLAHYIWFGAIIVCLLLPFVFMVLRADRVDPHHLEQAQRIRPSMVERFGLLVIIILGENLISIIGGAAYLKHLSLELVGMISLCLMIVFSLWWMYFDFVSGRGPKPLTVKRMSWMYLHLPLTMSIGLTAVGLLNVVQHADTFTNFDRWFIVGPLTLFLFTTCLLITTLDIKPEYWEIYKKGIGTALVSAGLLVLLGFTNFPLLLTLALTWILLTLPVFAGFKVWLRRSVRLDAQRTQ